MLIVMKFGGTSVGSAERIAEAAALVARSVSEGHRVVVVTSAMSGITNLLVATAERAARGDWDPTVRDELLRRHTAVAEQVILDPEARQQVLASISRRLDGMEKLCFGLSMVHELTPRLLDAISGVGECLCAPLLAGAIAARGLLSHPIEATAGRNSHCRAV